jgi:hypothetical protein
MAMFGVLAFVMTASDFRQKRLFFVLEYACFVFRHARSELPVLCSKDVCLIAETSGLLTESRWSRAIRADIVPA